MVFIDYNHSGDRALRVGDLGKKFEAFDWYAPMINGHEHSMIDASRYDNSARGSVTVVVVCNTVKGNGVPFMQSPETGTIKSSIKNPMRNQFPLRYLGYNGQGRTGCRSVRRYWCTCL